MYSGRRKVFASKGKRPIEDVASSSQDTNAPDVLGAGLGIGALNSQQDLIRERIQNERLVSSKTMELHIKQLERPLIDPVTGTRPLEVREPHDLHVHNLKSKMKIHPLANVLTFIVMVDPVQCSRKASFKNIMINEYRYYVIGECHSAEARRQFVMEYLDCPYFKKSNVKFMRRRPSH
ncbi:hypothetical protein O6H91_17G078100 [Diphasiastrum complanatum]|uniref:Uncharacterized protein n=2 Tax=Diphasiastrum complanatum TaxID=34168 RepID=A0ACC2B8F0_DIPCM|nr:hypothetical protein O6H91_17G078100 [Diphasiastrum complanatum]KAJ7526020.1 hypothetical protein O6H91_17G078100 [Diphasiastrum complanatum]